MAKGTKGAITSKARSGRAPGSYASRSLPRSKSEGGSPGTQSKDFGQKGKGQYPAGR